MPKSKQLPENQNDTQERLIEAIDNLCFNIELLRKNQSPDYSQFFASLCMSLQEIGNVRGEQGCLNKIQRELRTLNKTIIMAALLISATKNPEQTLNEYHKIIEQYLD